MTARIQQHVVSRHRQGHGNFQKTSYLLQRGSTSHATMGIALGLITLVFISLLGFFYLQQVLSTAAQGTDIHALESQMMELREEQRALELRGAELRSLQTVRQQVQELNLVNTEQVSYLAPSGEGRVASLDRI